MSICHVVVPRSVSRCVVSSILDDINSWREQYLDCKFILAGDLNVNLDMCHTIRLNSSSLVLVVIGRMSMLICNRFHERLANNGKITTFTRVPLFDALVPQIHNKPLS